MASDGLDVDGGGSVVSTELLLQWTRQGLALIGTHSAELATSVWRDHVEQHVAAAQRAALALSLGDWQHAQRTWAQPPDETFLSAIPLQGARPALLLSGLPEAFTIAGA